MIKLSILIGTIKERKDKFTKLHEELSRQKTYIDTFHTKLDNIEIVVNADNKFLDGGPSIGEKRQALLNSSHGEYICFLDDDETISPDYVETLLRLCKQGQDICTFRAFMKLETFWGIIDMRLAYKVNDQATPEHTMRRPPWHICPVKREYAILYQFNNKNNAEDFEWIEQVLTHCTTESHTERILFQYNHGPGSEADKITNYELLTK